MQPYEEITIANAYDTIALASKIYFAQDSQGNYTMDHRRARPICMMGAAGIGKTQIVEQVAKDLGLAFVSYSVTHHTRQTLLGLPRLVEEVYQGETLCTTQYTLSELIHSLHRAMETSGKQQGILFLDEFNCASETLRPALLQLLQDKSLGQHPLPKGWMLVLAGNPTRYNRSATTLDDVTTDRLRMLYVRPDLDAWLDYAAAKKLHPAVTSYLRINGHNFSNYEHDTLVTPRGWEDFATYLEQVELLGEKPSTAMVNEFIQSDTICAQFMQYYHQYRSTVASGLLEDLLNNGARAARALASIEKNQQLDVATLALQTIQANAAHATLMDQATAMVHSVLRAKKYHFDGKSTTLVPDLMNAAQATPLLPARTFLQQCTPLAKAENGWALVTEAFQTQLVQPTATATTEVISSVENLSSALFAMNADEMLLELMFHSICEDDDLCAILATSPTPNFHKLYEFTHFDCNECFQKLSEKLAV